MEAILKQILSEIQSLKQGQTETNQRLENLEGQVAENTQVIKALLHRTEELDAKYDGLLNVTASKDAIERIESKIDILSYRILAQDGEIQLLKKVK